MFNILVNNAVSLAVSMFCCDAFMIYTQNSYLYYLTQMFKYSDFMFWVTEYDMVGKTLLTCMIICIILNYCKGSYRIRYEDLERRYCHVLKKKKLKSEKENLI